MIRFVQKKSIGGVLTGSLFLLYCSSILAQSKDVVEIDAAGVKIKVPFPADLVAKKKELKTFHDQMKKGVPTNTIHEIFAKKSIDDATMIKIGLKRNGDVQTVNAVRNADQALFDQVKKILRTQFDQILADAFKDIKGKTGIAFESQEKVGKGTFVDKKNRFAYLMFSKVGVGDGKSVERVSASCVCFVKNRLVLFNLHSNLESEKDAAWVKGEAEKWIDKIVELNKVEDN